MSITKSKFFDISETELISLASVEEIGAISWNKIYTGFDSLNLFLKSTSTMQLAVLTQKQVSALRSRRKAPTLPKSIKLIKIIDSAYPNLLKEIPDPPLWLFVVGDVSVLDSTCLAVVGSRKNTAYAIESIKTLINKNVLDSITIVSGLAYGIDKLAHEASLSSDGKTIAVLAGGLDKIYPSTHRNLAKQIVLQGGLLISEYPPGSPAIAYKFPIRNRIIAGLSQATIVVEASIKSGTMTTAKSTIDYNRELFVVPGDINKKSSEGCNYLIAQGATPLLYKEQLLNFFNIEKEATLFDLGNNADVSLQTQQPTDSSFSQLIEDNSVLTIDQLAKLTEQSVEVILRELTILELAGKIYQDQPGYYRINKNG